MPKAIAFFDFDNTLIHGDAGPLFGSYLVRDRYEKVRQAEGRKAADRDRRRLLARYIPYGTWMLMQTGLYKTRAIRRSQIVRSAYKALKGVESDTYYSLLQDFVDDELADRIYPELVKIIEDHHAQDVACVIVTTGVEELVRGALKHFPDGVEVIGCRLEEKDGRFTGRVDGPLYGADKANIVRAYCSAAGIDPADCYAYSDHYSDYHMLEAVGNAICINPRQRLEQMADRHGWRVLRPADPREGA